jgi:hypothetical protein
MRSRYSVCHPRSGRATSQKPQDYHVEKPLDATLPGIGSPESGWSAYRKRVSGAIKRGRSGRPLSCSVSHSRHDDRAFQPMLGRARAAIPPCVLGSSQNRQQRGGGRAGGAAPPCALGSSRNRLRRGGGSRFLRFLEPGSGGTIQPDAPVNIRGDRAAAPGHNMLI